MNSPVMKLVIYSVFVVALAVVLIVDASSFVNSLAIGALTTLVVTLVVENGRHAHDWWEFAQCKTRYRRQEIRCSMSYLIRLKLDGKYILVWSDLFKHHQPIGGVYKRLPGHDSTFQQLKVLDDDRINRQPTTMGDLRLRIRGTNIPGFLAWYRTRKEREFGPWREFYQETVEEGILPSPTFGYVLFRWLGEHKNGIRYSTHYDCFELKIADIVEAILDETQEQTLRDVLNGGDPRLRLASEEEIRRLGVTATNQAQTISETGTWII